jgi:hypothetical protein
VLSPTAAGDKDDEPFVSGVVERAGVKLTLIDVEVTGRDGQPLRGLTKEDFEVRLDGREWPVYSVDDLCGCEPSPATATQASTADRGTDAAPQAAGDPDVSSPRRYILYFDFSQLQLDGRARAVEEAKRWVNSMEPVDEAMVVAYATAAGLRKLSDGFIANREALIAVIDEAWRTIEMVDPFPEEFDARQDECSRCCTLTCMEESGCGWCERGWTCVDCCPICADNAASEYFHGRRSLKALRRLLIDLQREPGRKHLLMFHQNGALYPARFYPVREHTVGDHLTLLDEVAGEATLARTVVHSAYTGEDAASFTPLSNQAVTLGLNIADLTGGSYNRGPETLDSMLREAGRGCECIYRVGLLPPERGSGAIQRYRVEIAHRKISYEGRIRFVDEVERWMREAEDVLRDPESAQDLAVRAALLPVRATGGGWDVVAQVALDLDALVPLPGGGGKRQGEWEVGALLTRDGGQRNWEMLGVSTASWELRTTGRTVVHSHEFRKLKPSRYRLAAFVRDRTGGVFGGAEVVLELPEADARAVVGPVFLISDERHLDAPLPLLSDGGAQTFAAKELRSGPVPAGGAPLPPGELLTVVSLLCGADARVGTADVLRYVSKDETPLFKFDVAKTEPAGSCVRLVDVVETWRLVEGGYSYHLRWAPGTSGDPLTTAAGFEVSAGARASERGPARLPGGS